MEILLKTKQANNPAFLFLTNTDPLHGFYRHLVYMIKTKQALILSMVLSH